MTKRKDSAIPNSKEMERERKMGKKKTANCEYCSNYVYDEEYGYYTCDVDLDEDEMGNTAENEGKSRTARGGQPLPLSGCETVGGDDRRTA